VFSDATVVERVKKEFVPVALKAGLVNFMSPGAEGRLYAEIGRSKIVPQGICAVNADGSVLAWAIMFEGKSALPEFLDHVLKLNAAHPAGSEPFAAERYGTFPGERVDDVEGRETGPAPKAHREGERCPALPVVEAGTLVAQTAPADEVGHARAPDPGRPPQSLLDKVKRLREALDGDEVTMETRRKIGKIVDRLEPLLMDRNFAEAEAVLDEALTDSVDSGRNDLSHVKGGVIAFGLRDAKGHLQIWVAKPDGSERRQLTSEGQNGLADWSPDGKKLTFMAIRENGPFIGVMNADGSNQKLFAAGSLSPDWSPDGRFIAFSRNGQIWSMSADGTGEKKITSSAVIKVRPSWSPDGKQMVFMVVRNPGSPTNPQPQIGIMNSDGTNERILTVEDRTNFDEGGTRVLETAHDTNAPSWSPVDDRVVFWSGIETKYGQVWSMRADGTASTQLTHERNHSNNDDPSWSPDGAKILFSTGRSGRNELWVMDADGSNEMRLFPIDADPFPGRGAWQPVPK